MDGLDKDTQKRVEEEKLSSMKEMMDNIAHQWRQPLSQINSIVTLIDNWLYERGIDDDFVNNKLLEIEQLTKYMSNTIDDFRGYFEESGTKSDFILSEVLQKAFEIAQASLDEAEIELLFKYKKEIRLCTYENELKQIVLVLLNNAKDILEARNVYKAKIVVEITEEEEYVVIKVIDNGGGMSKSVKDKIFEPYYTTKHKSQGTGLGLYMSKQIVHKRLGGELLAENFGKGSCFTIRLPKENTNDKKQH